MKTHVARAGATLTLRDGDEQTSVPLYSREGFDLLSMLWIKVAAEFRVMYEPTWLGRPIVQFPTDIVAMQELVWRVRPELIIETGVAHGGSLVLSASILELAGQGRVIGVDVEIRPHNRTAIENHPLAHRIELIEGSSVDSGVVERVRGRAAGARSVMVVLDSNHGYEHVMRELDCYAPLVTPGSYLVVNDGAQAWVWDIPRGKPEWKDDHPLMAIGEFLATHPEFEVDPAPTRFRITSSPSGFLRRKADG